MKGDRIIVKVFALILIISLTMGMLFSPFIRLAIKEPVTEEYYDFLKENALNVAKTLDTNVVTDAELKANYFFRENEMVITVESMKAKITAKIPISNSMNNEKGTIIYSGTAEFENVEYIEQRYLYSAWYYIGTAICIALITTAFILFTAWFSNKKQ